MMIKKQRLRVVVQLVPKLAVSLTAKMIFLPLNYIVFIKFSSHYSGLFMSFIIFQKLVNHAKEEGSKCHLGPSKKAEIFKENF